jgi:hypothetical protein
MTNPYFRKFPVISYSNTACLDLTRRVKLRDDLRNNMSLMFPYEVTGGTRPDEISAGYYEDPMLDWLIYLTNGIIDPYYGWYLDQLQFDQFIESKYGSIEAAQEKIVHWRVNWESMAEETISVSFYNNHLPSVLKKYYQPNYNIRGQIFEYSRKPDEWVVNTNRIISYDITISSGNTLYETELVDISYSGEVVCTGEVVFANSSKMFIQHPIGEHTANTTRIVTIRGEVSNTVATANNSSIEQRVISDEELIYWSPVYCYDYENELNESNKLIAVLDNRYAVDVEEELRVKLKAT